MAVLETAGPDGRVRRPPGCSRNPVEEIGASLSADPARAGYRRLPVHPRPVPASGLRLSPWLLQGEMAKMRLKKVSDYILVADLPGLAPELGLVRTSKGAFLKSGGIRLHARWSTTRSTGTWTNCWCTWNCSPGSG